MNDNVLFRPMLPGDVDRIYAQFTAQGWHRTRDDFEQYLHEQESGERIVIVAETGGEVAGYITLYPEAKDAPPFLSSRFPEIKDFNVFQKFRQHGIGTGLMDKAEAAAAAVADTVCLGVGLHSGYGSAQRMYVKRGYVPDGSGVWDGAEVAKAYGMVENGDALVLYFSKKLR